MADVLLLLSGLANMTSSPVDVFLDPKMPAVLIWVSVYAFFGALMRILYEWPELKSLPQIIGRAGVSIFVATLIGLLMWKRMGSAEPEAFLAITGIFGWLGLDGMTLLIRVVFRRYGPIDGRTPPG